MFSKQIIKDLEKIIMKKRWRRLNPEIGTTYYKQQLKKVLRALKESFQFYLGDFQELDNLIHKFFYDKKENTLELFKGQKLNLPYPCFVLCWSHPYEERKLVDKMLKKMYGDKDLKSAAIVTQETEDVISIQTLAFDPHPDSRCWFLSPLISFYTFKDDILETEFYKRFKNVEGGGEFDKHQNWFVGATCLKSLTKDMLSDDATLKVRMTDIAVVNLFLTLSNCPNVSSETVYRTKVKNKRKIKVNRLLDYKVLGVTMPSGKSKNRYGQKPSRENKGIMPINWCKGHKKTYVRNPDGTGGLGMYHLEGTWWWQPNVRGTKKAGFHNKDYNVKIKD